MRSTSFCSATFRKGMRSSSSKTNLFQVHKYENKRDRITTHSDKIDDLLDDYAVLLWSFYPDSGTFRSKSGRLSNLTRVMRLVEKSTGKKHQFRTLNNSCFILTPEGNAKVTHQVLPQDDNAKVLPRISVTARPVGTFCDEQTIWGVGATSKTAPGNAIKWVEGDTLPEYLKSRHRTENQEEVPERAEGYDDVFVYNPDSFSSEAKRVSGI